MAILKNLNLYLLNVYMLFNNIYFFKLPSPKDTIHAITYFVSPTKAQGGDTIKLEIIGRPKNRVRGEWLIRQRIVSFFCL
jgi:hypothetical protein